MAIPSYVSEITRLLNEVASDPAVERSQREGWHIFWDKKIDFDEMDRLTAAELPPKGYVYDASPPQPATSKPPFFAVAQHSGSGL
jgi:uncharacterized protein DUF3460